MDLYSSLIERSLSHDVSVGVAVVSVVVGPPLLVGIIGFERFGSDKKRTLLNMLTTSVCWINIWLLVIVRTLEILRFSSGPLPSGLCCFKVSLKFFLVCSMALGLDAVAITRHVYIFWLKNPAAFKDEFWHRFAAIWITACSGILTVVGFAGTDCKSLAFRVCNGSGIVTNEQDLPSVLLGVAITTSIALHVVVKVRVWIYESKAKVFPETGLVSYKSTFIKEMKKTELSSFVANLVCFFIMASAVASSVRMKTITTENLNLYPNYLLVLFVHLVAPTLFVIAFTASLYRKQALRRFVSEELRSKFNFPR